MGGSGRSIGRFINENFPDARTPVLIACVLLVLGAIGSIVWKELARKRQMDTAAFQAVVVNGDKGTLHLVARGAAAPPNVFMKMHPFSTARDVYHHVYEKFEETAYDRIVIHHAGTAETLEFTRPDGESAEESVARLDSLMTVGSPAAA
jgi:hypothetical protein